MTGLRTLQIESAIVGVFVLLSSGIGSALLSTGRNVCTLTVAESYSQAIRGSTSCGLFGWSRCTKITYRRSYRQKVNSFCCDGWASSGGDHCDEAICSAVLPAGVCPNGGVCQSPGVCSCGPGFQPPNCDDVDECGSSNGGCGQTCHNTPGSYHCSCRTGYGLASDEFSCKPKCFGQPPGECANGGTCTQTNVCICRPGYDPQNGCSDINECTGEDHQCDQQCVNTPGSYHCRCDSGYSLDTDTNKCIPVCGDSPAGTCPNGGSCIRPGKCQCVEGYQLPDCTDIDECLSPDACDQTCVNILGTFRCDCVDGYEAVGDGTGSCLPICHNLTPGQCPNGGSCIRPETCQCLSGFSGNLCSDVNECLTANGGCQQDCVNTNGSYHCGCVSGYRLQADGVTCQDIDECEVDTGRCHQLCENSIGFYNCSCRDGFQLDTNGYSCSDVNECETAGICQHTCVDIPGSYACSCQTGYRLDNDRASCSDVDECSTNNGGCSHTCHNVEGSFNCGCESGYSLASDKTSCEDIDECLEEESGCSDFCVNNQGSFHCDCSAGYRLANDGLTCHDIDECSTTNGGCAQTCENTPGTRVCSCSEGYILAADGASCQDASKCPFNGNINCWSVCSPGDDGTCECPDDTVLHADGSHCIDPCYSSPCFNGGTCHLTTTSFRCDCESTGYTGDLCQQGVVSFPDVIHTRVGVLSDTYHIKARPARQILLKAAHDDDTQVIPNSILITHPAMTASFQVLSKSRGVHLVTWNVTGPDSEHYTEIPALRVETGDVFTRLGLIGDVLPRGCFQVDIPLNDEIISLTSTQPWYSLKRNANIRFTQGIVFLESRNLMLPVSEFGLETVLSNDKLLFGSISRIRKLKDGQALHHTGQAECEALILSKEDHVDFRSKRSLLGSFLSEVGKTLPEWLSFSLEQNLQSLYQYVPKLKTGKKVGRIPSCYGAPVFNKHLYYVVRVKSGLILSLVGESLDISVPNDGSEEFCFILGLQNDLTFVIMFPDQVSSLLQSVSFFKVLKRENITVFPRGIGISLSRMLNTRNKVREMTFWNGDELFQYSPGTAASLWFGAEIRKPATRPIDYSIDGDGNIFVDIGDVRQIFTRIFADPWSAVLQARSHFDIVLKFEIFNEMYTIAIHDLLKVEANALASIGGQEARQYCGPDSNPPGFFVSASIDATLLRDLPIISNLVFNLNVRGYFFRILDSTQLQNIHELQSTLKSELSLLKKDMTSFLGQLSSEVRTTTTSVGEKLTMLKTKLEEISDDITDYMSSTSEPSIEVISRFLTDFIEDHSFLSRQMDTLVKELSLELSTHDWTSFSQMVKRFIDSTKGKTYDMHLQFLRQFNSVITGTGSWGVKGQLSVSLLGKDFLLSVEFVSSDTNIGHCGRFADVYKELAGEKAVRVTGVIDTEIDIKKVQIKAANIIWKCFLTLDGGAVEMALAEKSNKFIIRLEVVASFLGIEASANIIIRHTGMTSVFEADVWGIFTTRLLISADIFVPPSEMSLLIQGRFLPGGRSFDGSLGDAIRSVAKRLADGAVKRIQEAQKAVRWAKSKVTQAQSWLDEKKRSLDNADVVFDKAVAVLETSKQKLEDAKAPFQKALRVLKAAQKRVDGLCKIRTCSSICIPGIRIRLCFFKVWFLRIPYPCISFTSCMFRIPDPICILANIACRIVRGLAFVALEVAKIAVRIPMVALDIAKAAVTVAQIVVDKSRVLVEVVKVAFDLANLFLEGVKVILDTAIAALEAVKIAVKLASNVFDFIVKFGLQSIVDVKECGFDLNLSTRDVFEFEVFCEINLFSLGWSKIGFTVNFRNLLSSLWNAAKSIVGGALRALGNLFGRRKRAVEFIIYSRLHKAYRQRRETNGTDGSGNNNSSADNTIPLSTFNSTDFWTNQCTTYEQTFKFLRQGIDILRNVTVEMESQADAAVSSSVDPQVLFGSMQNNTPESLGIDLDIAGEDFNLTAEEIYAALNQSNPEDDDVIHESKSAAEFASQQNNESVGGMMNYTIIPVWKSEMENVTDEHFGGNNCSGFHDCVVYSFGELYQLVDSVDPHLVANARVGLAELESLYFELLENDTRSISEVKNVTIELLAFLDWVDLMDIFCGTTPVITESPVNVTAMVGTDVIFNCSAESIPPPMYYWYRNEQFWAKGGNLRVVNVTNVSATDEGAYRCTAGNHIDNTTSQIAYLSVVYPAKITSPLDAALEILSGTHVTIECPSSGVPFPTTVWYSTAQAIPADKGSTSLTLPNTRVDSSGIYACEASNAYGWAPSTESILDVFDGKPICPSLHVSLGYLTSETTEKVAILDEAGVRVDTFEEAMVSALRVLGKVNASDISLSVEKPEADVIDLFVSVNCESTSVCSEYECSTVYQTMLEKVNTAWTDLQTYLDSTTALFNLTGTTYFLNPSILDLSGVENRCPKGYRQLFEHACVNDAHRYSLPAPFNINFQQPSTHTVSWNTDPMIKHFLRGHRVVLQTPGSENVILNTTTTATSYNLTSYLRSVEGHEGYEIWIRSFTAAHQSQWTKKAITRDTDGPIQSQVEKVTSYLTLGLSLGGATGLLVLGIGLVVWRKKKRVRIQDSPLTSVTSVRPTDPTVPSFGEGQVIPSDPPPYSALPLETFKQ